MLALYALLGFEIEIDSPQEVVNSPLLDKMKNAFQIIKDFCAVLLSKNFHFKSNERLLKIRETFVEIYDISRELVV